MIVLTPYQSLMYLILIESLVLIFRFCVKHCSQDNFSCKVFKNKIKHLFIISIHRTKSSSSFGQMGIFPHIFKENEGVWMLYNEIKSTFVRKKTLYTLGKSKFLFSWRFWRYYSEIFIAECLIFLNVYSLQILFWKSHCCSVLPGICGYIFRYEKWFLNSLLDFKFHYCVISFISTLSGCLRQLLCLFCLVWAGGKECKWWCGLGRVSL